MPSVRSPNGSTATDRGSGSTAGAAGPSADVPAAVELADDAAGGCDRTAHTPRLMAKAATDTPAPAAGHHRRPLGCGASGTGSLVTTASDRRVHQASSSAL